VSVMNVACGNGVYFAFHVTLFQRFVRLFWRALFARDFSHVVAFKLTGRLQAMGHEQWMIHV